MAGYTFGLGPSDWLNMSNPLKTVAPIQSTATTAPTTLKTSTTSGPTAPIPSPLGGGPISKTFGTPAPLPSTGTFGNLFSSPPTATKPIGSPSVPAPTTPSAPTSTPAPIPTTPAVGADGLTDAQRTAKAAAAGMAASSGASSAAAGQAGQTAQSTQANAMNTASTTAAAPASAPTPGDPNVIKDPTTGQYRYLTQAEITDRAAHQGMGAAAAAASGAAGAAGQATESAQANAMNTASTAAAAPASNPSPTETPPTSSTSAPPPTQNAPPPPAQPPSPDLVTAPDKTTPSLDDSMALYEQTAQDWMNGKVDQKVFQTTANNAILKLGLNNNAQMDALKMRINSDPSLAGQGAGSAMLSMMAANQNFNADQLFGQLAQSAQQQILDMQKYGLTEGVAINQQRRQNAFTDIAALQDAGDFVGAAKLLAKTVDFPGVSIDPSQFSASRSRQTEDIQSLMTAGNYQGAAEKLAALTGKPISAADLQQRDPYTLSRAQDLESKGDYEGAAKQYATLGINVTADDLRAQSPFMQTTWSNTLDGIKATATTNPAAAEAQLAILMKNPAAAKYLGFSATTSAHDLIQSIVSGQYAADQTNISTLNTALNQQAKSSVPFASALANYKQQGPVVWQGMTDTGKKMAAGDLDSFNQARTAEGMGPVHKDANGNIVDANGTALTDEDFAETAASADYVSRKNQISAQPWQPVYDQLMAPGSPFHDKILSIPGGDTMVKQALMTQYLGGSYKTDPNTGLMEPDFTNGMPWDNPKTSFLWNDWPTAVFDAKGQVQGSFDPGGDPYGLQMSNGKTLQKMPDDENLDNKYAAYQKTNGTLSSQQWYFATAGGTMPPDATRIPASLQSTAENQTNVGTTGTTGTTGDGTGTTGSTGTPGSSKAAAADFATYLSSTASLSPDASAALTSYANDMVNAYQSAAPGKFVPLSIGHGADFDAAARRLKSKSINAENYVNADGGGDGFLGIGSTDKTYKGTPEFVNYTLYTKFLDSGMKPLEAQTALVKLIGDKKAAAAVGLEGTQLDPSLFTTSGSPTLGGIGDTSGLIGLTMPIK